MEVIFFNPTMVIKKLDPLGSSKPKVILIWWPQILVCRVCRGGASQAPEVLYSIPSMLSISIHDYHQQRLTYSSSFCCKYLGALGLCCLGLSFTFVCRWNFRALCWLPLSLIFYKLYLKEYSECYCVGFVSSCNLRLFLDFLIFGIHWD